MGIAAPSCKFHKACLCRRGAQRWMSAVAQKKEMDFFLVSEPAWLDEKYSSQARQVARPCAALVSTDQQWIT